jgi:putative peptidoglycan lipid II flippase
MSFGTVLSRVTGLLRLMAIAAALGVVETRLTDSYNYANITPNIIYELVLGGVLTSVFVPVFVELMNKEGRDEAWRVASAIINVSLVVLTAIATIGIIAAPWIARFFEAAGETQREIIAFLLRLCIPQIIFYGLAAITAGLLNAHKRFGPPMYTSVLNNLLVIAVFVAFHNTYPTIPDDLREVSTTQLWIIGAGTTAGVIVMSLSQLSFLRGLGRYHLTLSIRHPSVRKLARLSIYVVGYVIANQIGYLIVLYLAKSQQGGYSAYTAAFTFFMLPHGLFAVSIMTALLPGMSEQATNERWDLFRNRLSTGIRTTALLIVPAAVGYLVLGEQIVRLLLERGVMTSQSTELVAGVLLFFTLGLLPFSLFQLFLRAFYALQDTKTPFLINCGAVLLNIAVNIVMWRLLKVKGLAAGHAIAYVFGVTLQARVLSRRIGGIDGRRIVASVTRVVIAAIGMGIAVWGASTLMEGALEPDTFISQAVVLGISVVIGVVTFLALAHMLGVEELSYARSLLGRRFAKETDTEPRSPVR